MKAETRKVEFGDRVGYEDAQIGNCHVVCLPEPDQILGGGRVIVKGPDRLPSSFLFLSVTGDNHQRENRGVGYEAGTYRRWSHIPTNETLVHIITSPNPRKHETTIYPHIIWTLSTGCLLLKHASKASH